MSDGLQLISRTSNTKHCSRQCKRNLICAAGTIRFVLLMEQHCWQIRSAEAGCWVLTHRTVLTLQPSTCQYLWLIHRGNKPYLLGGGTVCVSVWGGCATRRVYMDSSEVTRTLMFASAPLSPSLSYSSLPHTFTETSHASVNHQCRCVLLKCC